MRSLKTAFVCAAAILWAAAASAHESAIGHSHPHPEIVGGDAIIVAVILGLALIALWMSRRAR